MIKAVRGTRDLLPPDTALWNFVEAAARDVFRAYNFQEIRTPIFEETQLFARSVGEETDIVAKEMYTWWDGTGIPNQVIAEKWLNDQEDIQLIRGADVEIKTEAFKRRQNEYARNVKTKGGWTTVWPAYNPGVRDVLDLANYGQ